MNSELIDDAYPLSPMQQGMLFHSLSSREPGVDIEQILCTLHEEINVPASERAWQRVVERHDILRTSFRWEGLDAPLQKVHPGVRVPFETKDWRGLPEQEWRNRLEDFLAADRRRGFDLAVAPLMRLVLIRTGEAEHQLVWTFHHLL
ncbi:MAG TPA: condensation domain-containing protein, partial [Verrucomicrobiae bacterium]